MAATLDNSWQWIQGTASSMRHPRIFGSTLWLGLRAWLPNGNKLYGAKMGQFDTSRQSTGMADSNLWSQADTVIQGGRTEMMFGGGMGKANRFNIANAPGIRNANRAFGYQGDWARLLWNDLELTMLLVKRAAERGLDMKNADDVRGLVQDAFNNKDMHRIAKATNSATGVSKERPFGSLGRLINFAPSFFSATIENFINVLRGLNPGDTSLEGQVARRGALHVIGMGFMLTEGINRMQGQDTDWNPVMTLPDGDVVPNPNFAKIRFGERDISIFGSTMRIPRYLTAVVTGEGLDALRGLASAPGLSAAIDLIAGSEITGARTRDSLDQALVTMAERVIPFSSQEIPWFANQFLEGVQTGDPGQSTAAVLARIHRWTA